MKVNLFQRLYVTRIYFYTKIKSNLLYEGVKGVPKLNKSMIVKKITCFLYKGSNQHKKIKCIN
jgi:hypothetical protein